MPGGYHRVCCCTVEEPPPPPPPCCQCVLVVGIECDPDVCGDTGGCTLPCCGPVKVRTSPTDILCEGTFTSPGVMHCVTSLITGEMVCTYSTCDPPDVLPCYPHSPEPNDYLIELEFPKSVDCDGDDLGLCHVDVSFSGCTTGAQTVYSRIVTIAIPQDSECGETCTISATAYYGPTDCWVYCCEGLEPSPCGDPIAACYMHGTCSFIQEWP